MDYEVVMSNKYRLAELVEHGKDSPHRGRLENPDITCSEDNPSCGDQVQLTAHVQNGRFKEVRVLGHGCIVSQASASLLAEFLKGRMLENILKLSGVDMAKMLELELGPTRMRCATLSLIAMQNAVREFLIKTDQNAKKECRND